MANVIYDSQKTVCSVKVTRATKRIMWIEGEVDFVYNTEPGSVDLQTYVVTDLRA